MAGIVSSNTEFGKINGKDCFICQIRRAQTVIKEGHSWQLNKESNWTILLAKGT